MKKKRNNLIYTFVMIGILLMLTNSCKKDNTITEQIPVLTTTTASNITQTKASIGGNIASDGVTAVIARGICWNLTENPTIADNKTADGTGTGSFTSSITGLSANTTYCARAFATNNAGTFYGNQISFTTSSIVAPTVTTMIVSDITQNTVISGGNITSDGGTAVIARGICWNSTENPTIADNKTEDGTGIGTFTSCIIGLKASTTYYARAYATNNAGTSYGSTISFRTIDGTVTDIDGNIYNTITIGSQVWMVENLKVTHYRNGDPIPNITDNTAWEGLNTGAYRWYNNQYQTKTFMAHSTIGLQ